LRRWRGNKTRAAQELGMARNTLRARLRGFMSEDAAGAGLPSELPDAQSANGSPTAEGAVGR
jgi:hypothetical protein